MTTDISIKISNHRHEPQLTVSPRIRYLLVSSDPGGTFTVVVALTLLHPKAAHIPTCAPTGNYNLGYLEPLTLFHQYLRKSQGKAVAQSDLRHTLLLRFSPHLEQLLASLLRSILNSYPTWFSVQKNDQTLP